MSQLPHKIIRRTADNSEYTLLFRQLAMTMVTNDEQRNEMNKMYNIVSLHRAKCSRIEIKWKRKQWFLFRVMPLSATPAR